MTHTKIRYSIEKYTFPGYNKNTSGQGLRERSDRKRRAVCLRLRRRGPRRGRSERRPGGDYARGNWSRALDSGEFLAVHLLAVDPAHKHEGIGGFLTDCAVAYAKENGYRAVRLDIVPENLPAKRLYTSRGFTSAGRMDLRPELEEIPLFELYELNINQ